MRVRMCWCGMTRCYIGQTFAGAWSYADDLTLIAPCRSAAQCMLFYMQLSTNFDVKFNATKTKLVLFLPTRRLSASCPPLSLFGSLLDVSKNEVHLGSMIGFDSESINVNTRHVMIWGKEPTFYCLVSVHVILIFVWNYSKVTVVLIMVPWISF